MMEPNEHGKSAMVIRLAIGQSVGLIFGRAVNCAKYVCT